MSGGRARLVAPLALVGFLLSFPALADLTTQDCVEANAKAQDLRRDRKFSAARAQLRACASQSCPAMVRDDCTKRLDELERAQPAIVFDAKDASGRDVVAVKVTVDGKSLADKLDGAALQVDPGEHVFVFTAGDQPPVALTLVIKEGDKERRERVVVGGATAPAPLRAPAPGPAPAPAPAPAPPPLTAAPSATEPAGNGFGTQTAFGIVGVCVGVVGIGVGSVYGIMTLNQKSAFDANPTEGTRTTGRFDGTVSTGGFIAGGALLAGGVALLLTGHSSPQQRGGTGLLVMPSAGPGSVGVLARGEF